MFMPVESITAVNKRSTSSYHKWILRLYTCVVLTTSLFLISCVRIPLIETSGSPTQREALAAPRPVKDFNPPRQIEQEQAYRIGIGDVLRIEVPKDPSLSLSYRVTSEGKILLPNIGSASVVNMTTEELTESLNETLSSYIRNPDVIVGIELYNSKYVLVVGAVRQPGYYPMQADRMTLLEAVTAAGFLRQDSAGHRVEVITPTDGNSPIKRQLNVNNIIYRGLMKENILLNPNDIVYVPSKLGGTLVEALGDISRLSSEFRGTRESLQDMGSSNRNDDDDR